MDLIRTIVDIIHVVLYWYLQNTLTDVVGDIASNTTNSSLVALHQYTPSFTLVMVVMVRVLKTILSESSVVLMNTLSLSPLLISAPSLYQVTLGNGSPSVLQLIVIVPPTVTLRITSTSLSGNIGITIREERGRSRYFVTTTQHYLVQLVMH